MPAELKVFDAIAARLRPGSSGTRLHGALTGALCADAGATPQRLLDIADVLGIGSEALALATDALRAACAQVESRLRETELGFTPLLPDDEEPLSLRVARLAEWCEAFIDGFSAQGSARATLSAESSELLVDISAIAGELEPDSLAHGSEEDERDYAEIVEFLRVAALSIFTERAQPGVAQSH